jgi:hypothetical protein
MTISRKEEWVQIAGLDEHDQILRQTSDGRHRRVSVAPVVFVEISRGIRQPAERIAERGQASDQSR